MIQNDVCSPQIVEYVGVQDMIQKKMTSEKIDDDVVHSG